MDLKLKGKTALVTGASMGIGRGIAEALGAEGVKLAIAARRGNLLEEVSKAIVAKGGIAPVCIVQDVLADDAAERTASQALAGLGAVDILINNAGGSRQFGKDATEEQWHEAMTLNFTRPRQLTHKLLDQMIARKWGRIISEQILRNYTPEYRKWQEENEIPVGRYGQPEDVAGLVSYLVSPLGGYITGTVIPVDGGLRRYQF